MSLRDFVQSPILNGSGHSLPKGGWDNEKQKWLSLDTR